MKLSQTVRIGAPVNDVWAFLMDVPRMTGCIPGMEDVVELDDDRFAGLLHVRVGPIHLTMRCQILVLERDPVARTAAIRGEATDERAAGTVKAAARMSIVEIAASQPMTELRVESDATVMGRIGEFGQPIIRRKADQLLAEFARNAESAVRSDAEDPLGA
jgi:carbon monoxide dehydrogenase subunit G